jgi:hypothetical protein
VGNHCALGVSTEHDLGVGALLKGLLNEVGHDGPTVGTQLDVALKELLC